MSSWARNRFDLRNAVIAVHHLTRVSVVVVVFAVARPLVWHVGLGIFIATVISFAGDLWLWRRLTPQLRIQSSSFDRSRVQDLFGMGGWLILNQVGSLMFLKVDLIVANTLLGAEVAGEYGSLILFSTMLRQLANTASAILTPTMLAKYAKGDVQANSRISRQAVKFIGLILALPVGLICGLARPLLALWLGPEFQRLDELLLILMMPLAFNVAVHPLFGLNMAFKKVRVPGIVTLVTGLMNVGLAVALVRLGWGALGIAAAGAIVLTLKNTAFMPIYAAAILGLPRWIFLRTLVSLVPVAPVVGVLAYAATQLVRVDSWLVLMMISGCIGSLYVAVVYCWILTKEDRALLLTLLPDSKWTHNLGTLLDN